MKFDEDNNNRKTTEFNTKDKDNKSKNKNELNKEKEVPFLLTEIENTKFFNNLGLSYSESLQHHHDVVIGIIFPYLFR